jgi:hypothetical protein
MTMLTPGRPTGVETLRGHYLLVLFNRGRTTGQSVDGFNHVVGKLIAGTLRVEYAEMRAGPRMTYGQLYFDVSPDRKRIVWLGDSDICYAAAFQGTKLMRWTVPRADGARIFWLADSRHWCRLVPTTLHGAAAGATATIYDFASPTWRHVIHLAAMPPGEFAGLTSSGDAVFAGAPNGSSYLDTVTTVTLSDSPSEVSHTVEMPIDADHTAGRVSPDGNRLAVFEVTRNRLGLEIVDMTSWKVTDVAGMPPARQLPPEMQVWSMTQMQRRPQWTPDGKSISFIHGGLLWLIPAPAR